MEVNSGMETTSATTEAAGDKGSNNSSLSSSSSSSLVEDDGTSSISITNASEEESVSQDQLQLPSPPPPMFFIKPIDSQGQSIAGKERLEDRGTVHCLLSSVAVFYNYCCQPRTFPLPVPTPPPFPSLCSLRPRSVCRLPKRPVG